MEFLKRDDISFEKRMVYVYRSEKKKIIRSQLHIVSKTIDILENI